MARRVLALVLVSYVLIVGGIASAKTVAHEPHHAHHQAATHGSPLCSWMCAAGNMSDAGVWLLPQNGYAIARVLSYTVTPVPAVFARTHASRAPPSLL